jgi:hypothetical protein
MNPTFTSVPFKTESGLSQIDGIAKFSSAGIVLEFESKFFGLIKGGIKEMRVGIDEILDVKFKKGFFKAGAKIQIRLKNFTRLTELPSQDGKLTLKIKREDFDLAKEAVDSFTKDLDDHNVSQPPVRTSVSDLFDNTGELVEDDLDTMELDEESAGEGLTKE